MTLEIPNLVISDKEIIKINKQVRRIKSEVNNILNEISGIIQASLVDAIRDKNISQQLDDISKTVNDINTEYINCCNELQSNMILYANQINDLDNFSLPGDFDNVLDTVINSIVSFFD